MAGETVGPAILLVALGILVTLMGCAAIALLYVARWAWRFITKPVEVKTNE